MVKQIHFNAFEMNWVVHQSPGLWTHPRDCAGRYTEFACRTELARLLERGRFDALFLADVLGVYDVYVGNAACSQTIRPQGISPGSASTPPSKSSQSRQCNTKEQYDGPTQ